MDLAQQGYYVHVRIASVVLQRQQGLGVRVEKATAREHGRAQALVVSTETNEMGGSVACSCSAVAFSGLHVNTKKP